jgi:hypothetical protein
MCCTHIPFLEGLLAEGFQDLLDLLEGDGLDIPLAEGPGVMIPAIPSGDLIAGHESALGVEPLPGGFDPGLVRINHNRVPFELTR